MASSRIPTFRSKGPQSVIQSPSAPFEISEKDIGKKVRVAEKEGVLRYVGNVHFTSGVWCGVELSNAIGKNNGTVQGKRYFACPQNCGLMAPLSKVALLEGYSESIEDGASGPYSMLFFNNEKDEQNTTSTPFNAELNETVTVARDKTLTHTKNNTRILHQQNVLISDKANNETFNKADGTPVAECQNRTYKLTSQFSNETCVVEVKRRRTTGKQLENTTPNLDLPLSSLSRFSPNFNTAPYDFMNVNKFSHSTPMRGDFEESLLRKLQLTSTNLDDDSSKRDSLECEESLGILTPDQMVDGCFMSMISSRTPSSECIGEIKDKIASAEQGSCPFPNQNNNFSSNNINCCVKSKDELASPVIVDASVTDFSLGIIDEQLLSNLTLRTDTTMNMELPLDTIDKSKDFTLTRLEQTPSPEELPLDPTPMAESDPKTEPSKSKTTTTSSSFITSITSITSLDTGYQGDGEMSRPASRGADNSPLTRRPLPRPQARRPDPMTDSDFYTESDADNHEENPLRGDRKAQVIDGTLYGVDPQAAADIYVNNRENMDSSGIFTDIESNPRNDDDNSSQNNNNNNNNNNNDISPSDSSSKTISGNSQNNIQELILDKSEALPTTTKKENQKNTTISKDNPKKRNAPSPAVSSPSSVRSPRHIVDDESVSKKFKMPKREVASKVKAMLTAPSNVEKKTIPSKKPAGRWDAVMNKISKTEQTKTNLKEVKSKVFNSVNATSVQRQNQKLTNIKPRRVRPRTLASSSPKSNVESSIHSSVSDLSASGIPPKNIVGSKKRDVVQVTQVLTPSKLSPRPSPQISTENKKTSTANSKRELKPKRPPVVLKDKKQPLSKDCGRATVPRPPVHARAPSKPAPKVAEALAVLVQHLVFNVEAYKVPILKKEVQKFRNEAEEIRLACQQLEETLHEERDKKIQAIEEERVKCANEISELTERHQKKLGELSSRQYELERLLEENETNKETLSRQHEDNLKTLKLEFQKLQKNHEESLDILREENDSIREQIDEKNAQIEEARHESHKLREDYEAKEMKLKEQLQNAKSENNKLKMEITKIEERMQEKLSLVNDENVRIKEENERILGYCDSKGNGISIQEVQSLHVVLELKQTEVAELRRALAEATQKNELLAGAEEKAATLNARCEDLELQLQRKTEYEQNLMADNKKLSESIKEELNQKKRLSQYNEELQWKLQQNKEVVSKVLEQAVEETNFNRTLLSASFNERHFSSPINNKPNSLERTHSFREPKNSPAWKAKTSDESTSPPTSPKVKGIVEKSDWVSYELDMNESPEIMASRIVRRSFRHGTPPKTTPTKSPSNKRPRMKNPLSLSASASEILPSSKTEYSRSRSLSNRNGDDVEMCWMTVTTSTPRHADEVDLDEEDVDLKLPALPSELGRSNGAHQALPSPKHLAGEAMISESNSEDESTSSSSVQL